MSQKRQPYPLQWPADQNRTPPDARLRSQFGGRRGVVSPYEAAKSVMAELDLMLGTSHITITSQLPTRHDGLPYSDGRTDDPGVAVWFVMHGHETVLACDHWQTAGENMHAIALTIGAMRGLERWGVASAAERAFAGFAALPGAGETSGEAVAPVKRPWREVLGGAWPSDLPPDEVAAIARGRHRKLIKQHHPDVGGDPARAAEINVALADAESEIATW